MGCCTVRSGLLEYYLENKLDVSSKANSCSECGLLVSTSIGLRATTTMKFGVCQTSNADQTDAKSSNTLGIQNVGLLTTVGLWGMRCSSCGCCTWALGSGLWHEGRGADHARPASG